MPQLNPSPWFIIMVFSWLVFLVVIPPKIMSYVFPNELNVNIAKTSDEDTWGWPWL
uniref:ATP synthase complex subunit 8 n=1 Tax=Serranus psittacinus TaxID=237562 RepID=Q7Y7W9_9TELE|nr:ATPase 8 [Serranus psittacinus]AAP92022.1 ATPase 8 [Serranus psittacinus]AAP92024.1 ATPase 8 [Serranus psittacinus]